MKPNERSGLTLDFLIVVVGAIAFILVGSNISISFPHLNLSDFLPELNPNLSNLLPSLYSWMPPMSALGFLLYLIPIYFIYRYVRNKNALAAAPDDQPFKVNLVIEPMKDSAVLGLVRGRKLTQSLKIDVKIGLKDWERIKAAGLMDATLFEHPNELSTYDGEPQRFPVKFLKSGPSSVCFYNISQAEEAKEELLKNIVNLRATVEAQKEGPQVTSFEI